jgi:hypothetical protein
MPNRTAVGSTMSRYTTEGEPSEGGSAGASVNNPMKMRGGRVESAAGQGSVRGGREAPVTADPVFTLVAAVALWLLELPGVGPINAAQVLVSWSHAGRLRSEAAFAALAGANPDPGVLKTGDQARLNRSGDRQLNRALHAVVVAA